MAFDDGFGNLDSTVNFSRVDSTYSKNIIEDPRQLVCQSRSNGNTYLTEQCTSLSDWTVHVGGTASITQVTIGEGGTDNPSGTAAFQLSSGATENSYCALNRNLTELPTSYGIYMTLALPTVSSNLADAFQITVQNTVDGRVLNLLFCSGQISVGDSSGAFHTLSTHAPPYPCENWIENKDNGDGTNTVSIYQGTQFIASQTVTMLIQSYPGMIYMQQMSGDTANQETQLEGFNIGVTQLPDAGLLQGVPYTAPFNASAVNVLFMVEDVCDDVVLGTDFTAALIIDGVEEVVTLSDLGSHGLGIIDYTKPIRYFWGSITTPIAQGGTVAYKAHMLNGKFMAVIDVSFSLTSIY